MQVAQALALRLFRTGLGKRLLAAQPLRADGEILRRWVKDSESSLRDAKYKTLRCEVQDDGVVNLSLARAEKRNAMNMAVWEELEDAFRRINAEGEARCVVLRGDGASFSTGMDLGVFAAMQALSARESCDSRKREALFRIISRFQSIISAPARCRVPVIAAVHGHCIGGAIDLITACDMRYTTSDALYSVKEVDLAIVADVGTLQRLPALVGDQRARELSYTGRDFDGAEAKAIGLALDAFASKEQLDAHVGTVAATIAAKSPVTVRGVKQALNYAQDHGTEDALQQVATWNAAMLMGEDVEEALGAAVTKRTPHFPRS